MFISCYIFIPISSDLVSMALMWPEEHYRHQKINFILFASTEFSLLGVLLLPTQHTDSNDLLGTFHRLHEAHDWLSFCLSMTQLFSPRGLFSRPLPLREEPILWWLHLLADCRLPKFSTSHPLYLCYIWLDILRICTKGANYNIDD